MAVECVTVTVPESGSKGVAADSSPTFSETVRARRSCRAFIPDKQVPQSVMRAVLEEARLSPSNCNTQPWHVHIVSGAKRDEVAAVLQAKAKAKELSPDFTFELKAFEGCYAQRKNDLGQDYYGVLGVARDDVEGRRKAVEKNFDFFDAPHAAFLFMPSVGDNVRVAGDIGMYAQTFLLSLTAHGLAGVPQTYLGFYADAIRECLNIPKEYKMLFGISFGYADEQSPINALIAKRAPIEETVTFHD